MKLEVFYDYACPFCLKEHDYLLPLLPQHPELELNWRPCEAHPRPEQYRRHSDLLARGFYIARDQGADEMALHDRLYRVALVDRLDIDDPEVVATALEGLVDRAAFLQALADGAHLDQLAENNREAWSVHGFDAVPSLCLNGDTLRSPEGIGLTPDGIAAFLTKHSA